MSKSSVSKSRRHRFMVLGYDISISWPWDRIDFLVIQTAVEVKTLQSGELLELKSSH